MKFGCCCAIDQSEIAHTAGFDFIECTVLSLQPENADFAPIAATYAAAALPVKAFNVLLPGDLKIVGPAVDEGRIERYMQSALERVAAIGATVVVFGSGRARTIPDGFEAATAEAQLIRFLQLAGDMAEPYGITIVIEPLNRRESNMINSVSEGVELAAVADRSAVLVLADLYHIQVEGEALAQIERCAPWLRHIHVADSGRFAPGTGEYPYPKFFGSLHAIGYDGLISVECTWRDFAAEAPAAVDFLRRMWAESAG